MRDRRHDMAQTVRHFVVLADIVPLKRHDLARYIAGNCADKIRASASLALMSTLR